MSARASVGSPIACSGAMYSGVPMTAPVDVSAVAAVSAEPAMTFEMPKSSSLTWSSSPTRKMLSGFRSRWMICLPWAAPTARSVCRMIFIARGSSSGPSRLIASASGWPCRSSITTYSRPSAAVPISLMSMMCGLPMRLAASASRLNRVIASLSAAYFSSISLMATRLPSSTCSASYTTPMPPRPI